MRLIILIGLIFISLTIQGQDDQSYNYEFALIEANRQKSFGNVNEAINLYKKCLNVKPNSGIAAYELGSIYISLNDADKAFEYFKRAYVYDPANYWYMVAYIEMLKIKGGYQEAESIVLAYLKSKDDSKLRFALVGIYEKQKNYKKAHKQLDQIELKNGLSEIIVLKRAEIYKKQNKINKGVAEMMRLRELDSETVDYYILVAEYFNEVGRKDNAAEYFLQAYKQDSTNLYAITNLADYHIQNENFSTGFGYLNKAFSDPHINLENKLKAIVYYLDSTAFIKRYFTEIEKLVISMLDLYPNENIVSRVAFDFYFKTEKYNKSFNEIKKLLVMESDNYSLWQQAIYNASLLGLNDELISLGTKAISYFPNKTDLYLFIGIGYFQKNDFENAYNILKENFVLGMDIGAQLQFLTFLGESAYKLGLSDEAFSYFEELILLDPNNLPILNNYSYYMALEGKNLERAEKLSYKTISRDPKSAIYLDTYGWILFKLNRFDEAKLYLEKAAQMSNDPDILFHYAEVLFKTDEKQKALEYYKKALEAGYDTDIIKDKIAL